MTTAVQHSAARKPAKSTPLLRGGLTCAFVPHNCTHDLIFNDVYLRTNRTNHTKIMRCFPHCCPGHRKRSYCGSPIYFEFSTLDDTTTTVATADLVVYGRFRPHNLQPLLPGDRLPFASIRSSLKSEDPSQGEWVESKLIRYDASNHKSTWLFEVNPSGRWYYPWSGAATIAMRATEHIFETLVFRQVGNGSLEFVAGAQSHKFRLMSFRRGVAGSGGPATADTEQSNSPDTSPKTRSAVTREAVPTHQKPVRTASTRKVTREKPLPVKVSPAKPAPMHLLEPRFSPLNLHRGDRLHQQQVFSTPHQTPHARLHGLEQVLNPFSVDTINMLSSLLPWLQEVPASSIGSRWMLAWERLVLQACQTHMITARRATGSARSGLIPILSALHVPSIASPSSSSEHSKPPPTPLDAIDAAVRVLLHVWLDVDSVRASDAEIQRVRHRTYPLDRHHLTIAHATWLRDAESRAKRYLNACTRTTWTHLVGMSTSHHARSHFDHRAHGPSDEFSYRAFVAQWRQQLAQQEQANHTDRSRKRRRTDDRSSWNIAQQRHVPAGLQGNLRVWISRMEDVSIELGELAPNALSLLTVIQFWRHLSCIRLDYAAATLSVASVFNGCVADGQFSRLVLDGKHRWFSSLPSGGATTGTTLMDFIIGDYVGCVTSVSTIHITMYLWPSAHASSSAAVAYAWHWTMDATSLTTGHTAVSIVVESARVHHFDPLSSFETMSIAEKMRCIGRWQHVCQAQLGYNAQ